MKPATLRYVEDYWSDLFGVARADLFGGVSVRRHAGLGEYPGVFVAARGQGCHVSVPEQLSGPVTRAVRRAGRSDLVTPAWWRAVLGGGYVALGPSVHHYLDQAGSLPQVSAGPVERASLEPLRHAVSPEEWREGGFAEEAGLLFAVTSEAGDLAAAANLTVFGSDLADVGVLTHPGYRGRGFGLLAAAGATRHSLRRSGLARWRARAGNVPSLAIARHLGFEPWCEQLAVRPGP